MKTALAIFDLDGTLFDTETAFIPAMEKFFKEFGRPVPSRDELMALVGEPYAYVKNWMESFNLGEDYATLRRKMIDYECEAIFEVGKLFDGSNELLDWLNAHSFAVCLCTNATNDYLDAVLKKCAIREKFQFIYNPQAVEHSKPWMTEQIIKESGIKVGYFIGDRYHDIEAGKINSLKTVGCRYGYGKEEIMKADILIDNPLQLIKHLPA